MSATIKPRVKLYHGDCLDVFRRLPDHCVDSVVTDPFVGSGTMVFEALKLGRKAIGIERDAEYHATAKKRIAEARSQRSAPVVSPASVAPRRGTHRVAP